MVAGADERMERRQGGVTQAGLESLDHAHGAPLGVDGAGHRVLTVVHDVRLHHALCEQTHDMYR